MTIAEMEAKGLNFDKVKNRWSGKPDARYSTEQSILPSPSEISGDEIEKTILISSLPKQRLKMAYGDTDRDKIIDSTRFGKGKI